MALELITDIDLKLLSLHWVRVDTETVAILRGDGQPLASFVAEKLVDKAWDKIAKHCANRGYKQAYLYAKTEEGKLKRYPVAAELASQNSEFPENNLSSPKLGLDSDTIWFTPNQELSIGILERSPLATYINAIKSQKKFYANPVALNAQGKPPVFTKHPQNLAGNRNSAAYRLTYSLWLNLLHCVTLSPLIGMWHYTFQVIGGNRDALN